MQRRLLLVGLAILSMTAGGWMLLRDEVGTNMVASAQAFVDSLDDKQKKVVVMDYDDSKRLDWHFIPKASRKGLQIREMNEKQAKLAHGLLAAAVSKLGYQKATTIMELEQILKKLEGAKAQNIRDNLRYYFTLFGQPSADARWGFSIEGHHLSLNFVVDKGSVAAFTPFFLGANPADVKGDYGVGPKKGTRVLKNEEEFAFKLINSCDEAQLKQALLAEMAPKDIRGAGDPQPPKNTPTGLSSSKMTKDQLSTLKSLITSYTDNMPKTVAAERLAAIDKDGLDKIYFAWEGARKSGIGHYYRVEGPSFQIEFCNVQPDAAGNIANHIHAVWRNPAGDFGIPVK